MYYKAIISVDDDRWCKKPYSISVYNEAGDVVLSVYNLCTEEDCFRILKKKNITPDSIETEFY